MASADASPDRIAVAGVSRDANGTHASNGIYTRFKERGYEVFPVNPNADEIMGDPCYRSLKDIPGGVDGVVIATNPKVSLSVAQEWEPDVVGYSVYTGKAEWQ